MSKVVLISVASSVGLGLLSLHLVKQLKEGEATIAGLKAQVASLQEHQQQPPPRELSAFDESVEQRQLVAAAGKQASLTAGGSTGSTAWTAEPDRMRVIHEQRERERQRMQDREYLEAMRVHTRDNFARQYPGVIEELGLDAQQADEFFDLLAEQQRRGSNTFEPIWNGEGIDADDEAAIRERLRKLEQLNQENQRLSDAEISARFGQDKLQAWKEYQSTLGMRYELENLRATLAANGMPVRDDLSKPMLKAMAQANQSEAKESAAAVSRSDTPGVMLGADGKPVFDGSSMDRQLATMRKRNQRMLDAISPYLSFEQRAAVENQQQAQQKVYEAQLQLMRAQGKSHDTNVFFVDSPDWIVRQR